MEQENSILIEQKNGITLINIKGDITASSEMVINKTYQDINDQGASKILLKLDQNAYINSGGIAVLIQLLAETKKNRQQVGIVGISAHFKKIFTMVGITKFSRLYDSVDIGVKDLSGEL